MKRVSIDTVGIADASVHGFNNQAGGQKVLNIGHHLIPLSDNTTTAATVKAVEPGMTVAIYNNSGTAGSVNIGSANTITSLAIGVVSGDSVGIACKPNDWTYVAMYDKKYIITSAPTLICYLVKDDTRINP